MAKIKFNKFIAFGMSIMAVIVLFTALPSSKLQVSAETVEGSTYGVQYAKDDDKYYFATETNDLANGLIISPLGYFCSFYNKSDGSLIETVFVSDNVNGRAYYDSSYEGTYKYRIPRADILRKLSDSTYNLIASSPGNVRLVFDTVLTTAWVTSGGGYSPAVTLSSTDLSVDYVKSSLSGYNNGRIGSSTFFTAWTTMGCFINTGNTNGVFSKATALKVRSSLYVSSAIHSTAARKEAALGNSNYNIAFSQTLYNSYEVLRADNEAYSIISHSFNSKDAIYSGYFSVPTPPDAIQSTTNPVDLYCWGVEWYSDAGYKNYVAESTLNTNNAGENLVEGNTYYPKFLFRNKSGYEVKAWFSVLSYNNAPYGVWEKLCEPITISAYGWYGYYGEPVTISNSTLYSQYQNNTRWDDYYFNGGSSYNLIKYWLEIQPDDSNYYESNSDDNTYTTISGFAPKQATIDANLYDGDFDTDSLIKASLEKNMIYSGQNLKASVTIQNNSSFNLFKNNMNGRSGGLWASAAVILPNMFNGINSDSSTLYWHWNDNSNSTYGHYGNFNAKQAWTYATDVGKSTQNSNYNFDCNFRPLNLKANNDADYLRLQVATAESSYYSTHGGQNMNNIVQNAYGTSGSGWYGSMDMQHSQVSRSYWLVPTDVRAVKGVTGTSDNTYLYLEDVDTNKKIDSSTKLKDGQEVRVVSKFYNETILPVAVTIRTRNANASGLTYDNAIVENSLELNGHVYKNETDPEDAYVNEQTVVIPAKTTITVKSQKFNVSAKNSKEVYLASSIYLYGLDGNVGYETKQSNNINQVSYNIESPFSSHQVLPNSTYRRDTKVITSFFIYNNNNVHKSYGTSTDIKANGKLVATLKIWDNKNRTGEPIADVDCEFAIPASAGTEREYTMVWFEWEVPANAPDTVYAELICDGYNNFASTEFIDNGVNDAENGIFNSKNDYYEFNIVQPVITQTPDTTFARWAPSWYEDGVNYAKIPNVKEGIATLYDETTANGQTDTTKWSYWTTQGDTIVFLCKV